MIWQPIETAPKDRTEILLYRDGVVYHGWWGKQSSGRNGWIHERGWFPTASLPTHWMPLPPPPLEPT